GGGGHINGLARSTLRFVSHASSTTADFGLQMQVRQERSSPGAPWHERYSTSPDFIATRHVPQLPARQPDSILCPFASSSSSTVPQSGLHLSDFPDRPNVTSMATLGEALGAAAVTGVFCLTVAGPNASKKTLFFGTPQPSRSEAMASMKV